MPLIRTLLIVLLVYVVWRMARVVARAMNTSPRDARRSQSQAQPKRPVEKFHDVQDAHFEDLPPERKKK